MKTALNRPMRRLGTETEDLLATRVELTVAYRNQRAAPTTPAPMAEAPADRAPVEN